MGNNNISDLVSNVNKCEINPNFDNSKIIYITTYYDQYLNNLNSTMPAFWLVYNNDIYFGICDYTFQAFENYDDWYEDDNFNQYRISKREFDRLFLYSPMFYKFNHKRDILESDCMEFCDHEVKILTTINRDIIINKLLDI